MARHFLMLFGFVLIIINNLVSTTTTIKKKLIFLNNNFNFGTDYSEAVSC